MTLVIFDCDGVLVDSETISISVLRDLVDEAGISLSERTAYERFLGRSMATIAEILETDFGLKKANDYLGGMRERVNDRFERELSAIQNVAFAVDTLSSAVCVASSSKPERIKLSLRITGLLDRFEPNIFSASMVRRGKPNPDLFLHAAKCMGFQPSECIVIEDSPAGIQAAKRAGMRVLAFTGGSHAQAANLVDLIKPCKPDLQFNDMLDLPRHIANIG